MSSHKEAPGIVNDAAADNTDVYAFVSPDDPRTVTLIANFVPLEEPDGGPNFFEFGDDVLYQIHISNSGTALADITYQFRFRTEVRNEDTFLYNTGPITSLNSPNWNRRQFYSMVREDKSGRHTLVTNAPCPPCNIGPGSTPDYAALAEAAVTRFSPGSQVFAGQRAEGFYVDLGAIFDLADLRPFQNLNTFNKMPAAPGINSTKAKNIHSIVLQVPKSQLSTRVQPARPGCRCHDRRVGQREPPADPPVQRAQAQRREQCRPVHADLPPGQPAGQRGHHPAGQKRPFNCTQPRADSQFAPYVAHPELAALLPVIYPGVFPNLAALNTSGKPRADLEAILLTGIPAGIVAGLPELHRPYPVGHAAIEPRDPAHHQ